MSAIEMGNALKIKFLHIFMVSKKWNIKQTLRDDDDDEENNEDISRAIKNRKCVRMYASLTVSSHEHEALI